MPECISRIARDIIGQTVTKILGSCQRCCVEVDHRWIATSVIPSLFAFLSVLWHQGNFPDATKRAVFRLSGLPFCLEIAMIIAISLGAIGLHGLLGTICSCSSVLWCIVVVSPSRPPYAVFAGLGTPLRIHPCCLETPCHQVLNVGVVLHGSLPQLPGIIRFLR
jgi:hypothetical protein